MNEIAIMAATAVEAGHAILEIYGTGFEVEEKSDHSPITTADRKAHDIITARLEPAGLPILSEEGRHLPYDTRKGWARFFLVDPLDGTREFIKRNGEFTVNIAVIENHRPVAGVIYVPVRDVLYLAARGSGAFRIENASSHFEGNTDPDIQALSAAGVPLPLRGPTDRPYTVIGSRSHSTPELEAFVHEKEREHGRIDFISAGSSLKFCRVAEGSADIYPRTGPTCEWDTAAGQAIAEQAGATVKEFHTGKPLRYNKEDLLNPWFVVERRVIG
ncbi:MAG: 3'(2'),5'-bisphosphate nucleotidase CysQ [Desulfobacterales bacterium]